MLTEDIDLAFKLTENKMRVEHASHPVYTYGPDTFKSWFKQKTRWCAGGTQCYLKHYKIWLKHPLQVIFLTLYSILSIFFLYFLVREFFFFNYAWDSYWLLVESTTKLLSLKIIGVYYGALLLRDIMWRIFFSIYSVPYAIPLIKDRKSVV